MSNYSREEVVALLHHSLHHNQHHKEEMDDLCEAVNQLENIKAGKEMQQILEKYDQITAHLKAVLKAVSTEDQI